MLVAVVKIISLAFRCPAGCLFVDGSMDQIVPGGRKTQCGCNRLRFRFGRGNAFSGRRLVLKRAKHDAGSLEAPEAQAEAKDQLVMGIKEDANWLLNMVENLLSITRIQSNGSDTQPHVKKVPEPLEEVVAEAIQRYQKRYPDSELKVKIPEDFLMVPMDPTLIEQVIMNLLENAWVHSGSDAPIEFDIKEEGNKVVFYIRDHGNGIAPERLDQLFDGCAGALDHESRKGMGIGLSICKSIVMAHQGDVYARNYEDGAEFSFSLPMDEKELTEEKEL